LASRKVSAAVQALIGTICLAELDRRLKLLTDLRKTLYGDGAHLNPVFRNPLNILISHLKNADRRQEGLSELQGNLGLNFMRKIVKLLRKHLEHMDRLDFVERESGISLLNEQDAICFITAVLTNECEQHPELSFPDPDGSRDKWIDETACQLIKPVLQFVTPP